MIDYFPKEFPDEKYKNEVWAFLDNSDVNGIEEDRYQISTYGRLYDRYKGKYYPTENVSKPNYTNHIFYLPNGEKVCICLHLLAARKFKPIFPADSTDVDHIDGVRYHNWIWNLDFVTHAENLIRAVHTGLYPVAENQQNAIFTNDQIRKVCQLISEGYSPDDIVTKLKPEIPNIERYVINDIKAKRQWVSISDEYDFSNMYSKKVSRPFTENEVRLLCTGIEKYGYYCSPFQIAVNLGIPMNELDEFERNRYINCISRLRRRLIFKDIVKDYNF